MNWVIFLFTLHYETYVHLVIIHFIYSYMKKYGISHSLKGLNPFLPDAASTLHYPFLPDVASMRSSLFTDYICFDSLYGQIGLSHDETKFPDSKFPGFPVLVNQASLQMLTSNMTHCQYFHVILSCFAAHIRCRYNNRAWISKNKLPGSY